MFRGGLCQFENCIKQLGGNGNCRCHGRMSFHVEFRILYGNVSKVFTILSVADEMGEYATSQGMTAEILELLLNLRG